MTPGEKGRGQADPRHVKREFDDPSQGSNPYSCPGFVRVRFVEAVDAHFKGEKPNFERLARDIEAAGGGKWTGRAFRNAYEKCRQAGARLGEGFVADGFAPSDEMLSALSFVTEDEGGHTLAWLHGGDSAVNQARQRDEDTRRRHESAGGYFSQAELERVESVAILYAALPEEHKAFIDTTLRALLDETLKSSAEKVYECWLHVRAAERALPFHLGIDESDEQARRGAWGSLTPQVYAAIRRLDDWHREPEGRYPRPPEGPNMAEA